MHLNPGSQWERQSLKHMPIIHTFDRRKFYPTIGCYIDETESYPFESETTGDNHLFMLTMKQMSYTVDVSVYAMLIWAYLYEIYFFNCVRK